MQKILFITPPFVQMNVPYPATAYLKGFCNKNDVVSSQMDLSLEVILKIFSKDGLELIFSDVASKSIALSENSKRIFSLQSQYISTIDSVISFLQNRNPSLAHRICADNFLPKASRFEHSDDLDWAFGTMGQHDKARHLSTLYLEDISDIIVEAVDSNFGFSRYAEHIALAASSFDTIYNKLQSELSFVDTATIECLKAKIEDYNPTTVAISVPFPGNLFSTLRCGQWLKENHPKIKILIGGGYPNTELRSLSDTRIFEFVDYISLDDGEATLLPLLEHIEGKRDATSLKRTLLLENGAVSYKNGASESDVAQADAGTPDYSDLPNKKYLSVIETINPMHRLWSDGRWNKLTLAHGCYWAQCAFCDTSLDYIKRYDPSKASVICDRMEAIIEQTGETGFHFVDEAAPPSLMKQLALEIIKRKLPVTWWTNVRFEKRFSKDLCFLLKESGCIAISGGLEVASNRLLKLINKGVSIEQVTKVVDNFTEAGIMVHTYLMYGFPTETAQETIDSLEVVRQLLESGVIQSGFWHRFSLTAHSPVGLNPEKYNVTRTDDSVAPFANNDLEFTDKQGADHSKFGEGLRTSLYNYMQQNGFDVPLKDWFDFKTSKTTLSPSYIKDVLDSNFVSYPQSKDRLIWLGNSAIVSSFTKRKKKHVFENTMLTVHLKDDMLELIFDKEEGLWLAKLLDKARVDCSETISFGEVEKEYEETFDSDFAMFWSSKSMIELRENGLLAL